MSIGRVKIMWTRRSVSRAIKQRKANFCNIDRITMKLSQKMCFVTCKLRACSRVRWEQLGAIVHDSGMYIFVQTRCIILFNVSHPKLMSRIRNSGNSCTTAWQYYSSCIIALNSFVSLLPLTVLYISFPPATHFSWFMIFNWSNDLSSIWISVLQSLHDGAWVNSYVVWKK